jgi:hypothetical protein
MSKALNGPTFLPHRLGVAGPACVRAFTGTGAGGWAFILSCRWILSVLATTLCALAFTAAPAPAAAPPPEEPVTVAGPVTGTSAVFEGTLNPHSKATVGGYFVYSNPEGLTCAEGPTMALEGFEGEHEVQAQPVHTKVGLEPDRKYKFCLVATNEAGAGATPGNEVEVVTPAIKPAVAAGSESTTAVTPFEATLHSEVDANNQETTVYFQYSASPATVGESLATPTDVPAAPGNSIGSGFGNVATEAATGHVLSAGTPYYFQAVAVNPTGATYGPVEHFTTLTAEKPIVEPNSEQVSEVGAKDAKLQAQVNPNYQATTYVFEYASSEATVLGGEGTKVPGGSIPAGFGAQTAGPVDLGGALTSDTTYYYRVLATDPSGTTPGGLASFTTFPPASSALPDGRVYELVSSPPGGHDVDVYVQSTIEDLTGNQEHGIRTGWPFEVAPSGEAVVYAGDPPVTGGTGKVGESNGNEYLARRLPEGGWTQAALEGAGTGGYVDFSPTLSVGVLAGGEVPGAGTPPGYYDWYEHATASGVEGDYHPFFTATPDRSSLELNFAENSGSGYMYAGGNSGTSTVPEFTDLLFETNAGVLEGDGQLEQELGAGVEQEVREGRDSEFVHYLYDTVAGRPHLVDVLPDGKLAPRATYGSLEAETSNGYTHPGLTHAISADGSRVFWTWAPNAEETGGPVLNRSEGLYVRENPTQPQSPLNGEECTVPADACTVQVGPSGSIFQTASADGSKVFFIDAGEELDEYDLEIHETIGLAPGVKVAGVAGVSEDGEYVYYIDAMGNVELWHDGVTTLVAPEAGLGGVSPFASGEGGGGYHNDYITELGSRTAEVTPDGHSLIFMSTASLTGYDNVFEGSTPLDEVFLYEADTGKLTCVSCNPSGEPPVPVAADTASESSGQLVGAFFPLSGQPTYQPQSIAADGSRVFFDSAEPLVPQDRNGWIDVYEWERDGTGNCTSSGGCIYLLSGGTDRENSYLIGSSASGDDVFFISRAQLTRADDGNDDSVVYDARVNGYQPPAPSPCSGTGCQGVPPPSPIFATPSSVTFDGVGNFPSPSPPVVKKSTKKAVRCAKGMHRSHSKCMTTHHRKKKTKAKKARRATSDRRGN